MEEGGPKNRPAKAGRILRSGTSRGAAHQVLRDLLLVLEISLEPAPNALRAEFRSLRARLELAYRDLQLTESDVAQALAEADGEEFDDAP